MPKLARIWLVVPLLAVAYVCGALAQARWVNVDATRHDQDSYLAYAASVDDSHFAAVGNRLQMPALPSLLALFHHAGEPQSAFFERAKLVCIGLSVPCALAVIVLLRRTLRKAEATVLTLLVVFFVFSFRAAYVQAELLSYACLFAGFVAMANLWRRPGVAGAVVVGLLLAAAFVVKGTALVGFYVFAATFTLRQLVLLARTRAPRHAWALLAPPAAFGVFFAVAYPYLQTSKLIFGGYFHNMSSAYVMWCDSWEQYTALESQLHLNLEGWKLPASQVPSAANYLGSHRLVDIAQREIRGLAEVAGNALVSHGYAPVVLLYGGFAATVFIQHPRLRARALRCGADSLAWFVVPYLAAHALLFGFYGAIAAGNRFSLAMLLPAMTSLLRTMGTPSMAEYRLRVGSRHFSWNQLNQLAIIVIAIELALYFPYAVATHYSGG